MAPSRPSPSQYVYLGGFANRVLRTDTLSDLVTVGAQLFLSDLGPAGLEAESEGLRTVTPWKIKAAVDRWLEADGFHYVVAGDPEVVLPQLQALGPVTVLPEAAP